MKKLHLLCNAHIDPVWLWQEKEGIAEAISTFRVAADFCEQYDGFVFNHNEALLYEWVEEHEPDLFARIQRLVAEKKWNIMGGWYLQPDCVMTSGESLMSQIELGREYFEEKFGVKPTTAINFDPFGHSRGLVQILRNAGYDSYIFMRPESIKGNFWWEGFDGSRILGHGMYAFYSTKKGEAINKVKDQIANDKSEVGLCLWGVGNHGGGPSRIDLETINGFIKESYTEIVHSGAEQYFAEANREDLEVIGRSLGPFAVGCYTSMARIKQANRRLENSIALTSKIMSYAEMATGLEYNADELKKARKALAFCQFHDVLPGTSIKPVEDDSLRTLGYGEEIVEKLYTKAFFKLCAGQKKARDGEIPIMIFNPHPYEIEGEFEVEFMLQNQNWTDGERTVAQVYDENGRALPTQNEKPQCTFNLDWIQKVCFYGKIAPSSVSRFDCTLTVLKKDVFEKREQMGDSVCISNGETDLRISRKTGLIEHYAIDGKTYIENSGILEVYRDDEDPWGMRVNGFKEKIGSFTLMSDEEANAFVGYPDDKSPNVRIVEDGAVRTKVQAFFSYKRSVAVVEYTLPKNSSYIDVDITMYSNEPCNMIKYRIDTALCGKPWGETAFGFEELYDNEDESVFHKWCGIKEKDDALYVLNRGTYGGSFDNSTIKLSLLRTPIYSAHPINDRPIAPHDKFINHIDMGERHFSFRISAERDIARAAQIYNEAPQALSFFPSGEGEKISSLISIDNPDVILSSMKKKGKSFVLNLYNASENESEAEIFVHANNKRVKLKFGKHEIKTQEI